MVDNLRIQAEIAGLTVDGEGPGGYGIYVKNNGRRLLVMSPGQISAMKEMSDKRRELERIRAKVRSINE